MNIMFGLCGEGSRFAEVGYPLPKYLIAYQSATMIYHAVETLDIPGKIHFIVRQDHLHKYKFLEKMLLGLGSEIIICDSPTEGAAQTLLLAKNYVTDLNAPLISANCDQYLKWDSRPFIKTMNENPETSYILTYKETSTKCSYIRKDSIGNIVEVREKKVISNDATIGVYHWAHSRDFFVDAEKMISTGIKDNNEYYVAPVYNHTIDRGLSVKNFEMKKDEFWSVGTPKDLQLYITTHQSDI